MALAGANGRDQTDGGGPHDMQPQAADGDTPLPASEQQEVVGRRPLCGRPLGPRPIGHSRV